MVLEEVECVIVVDVPTLWWRDGEVVEYWHCCVHVVVNAPIDVADMARRVLMR